MKKNVAIFALLATLFSCNKVPEPTNEKEDKGHEEPTKIEIVFTEETGSQLPQILIFQVDESTRNVVRKNKEGKILKQNQEPVRLFNGKNYQVELNYYNVKNELMNHEFLTSEQRPKHQHFFTIDSYKNQQGESSKEVKNIWKYQYLDEGNDPVGLKGRLTPTIAYAEFFVRLRLLHVNTGTKYIGNDPARGVFPFDNPSADLQFRSATDFDQTIPIVINQ